MKAAIRLLWETSAGSHAGCTVYLHHRKLPTMADHNTEHTNSPDRRQFVRSAAGLSAASIAALSALDAAAADSGQSHPAPTSLIQPGQTILFQGDSITDASRKKNDTAANSQPALGKGYAWLAAAELLVDRPNDHLKIYNRGISGNKVYQLAERWQTDCLDLKPDVLSILIGVNDYWHLLKHGYDGTLETYEHDYRQLLQRTLNVLPNVKLVICEPFVLKVGAVDEDLFPAFDGYRAAAKRLAETVGATFVPFQTMFDLAAKIAPPERWAADGVHPTTDGAALMAHLWLQAVNA
jgi:lysophospholipase L1-like esterase